MQPRYRIWSKTEKRMVRTADILSIDYENEKTVVQKFFYEDGLAVERDICNYRFKDTVFMQSTDIKDKNGKEIFEYDVVSLPQFGDLKPWTGVVKRMEGKWVIDTGKMSITLWSEIEETEVLGNMFENPNLVVYRFVPTVSAFEDQEEQEQA